MVVLAVIGHIALLGIADAFNQFSLSLKQTHDLAQRDLFRLFRQHMSAFGAADTVDHTGLFQGTNQLFKIFNGDVLAFGDFANLDGSLVIVAG